MGIGSATTARMTYNFMSPEGKRRFRLEVIRHFAGQNTKQEEHAAKSLDARVGEKTPEKDKKRLPATRANLPHFPLL